MSIEAKLEELNYLLETKESAWQKSPYELGLYNGIEFILSVFEDREPEYKEAPKEWCKYEN